METAHKRMLKEMKLIINRIKDESPLEMPKNKLDKPISKFVSSGIITILISDEVEDTN